MNYLQIGKALDLKNPKERKIYRIFEISPGLLSWATLFGGIFLSWKAPFLIACFIIAFVIFWFFRTIYYAFHLRAGFQKMKEHEKINWLEKLKHMRFRQCSPRNYEFITNIRNRNKFSEIPIIKQLPIASWRDIYHLVLLPNYKEPFEIIKEGLESLIATDYPKDRMIVVLSFEERAGPERKKVAEKIKKEFEKKFFKLLITFHPANLPGEIPGHGSNDAWAAKEAKEKIIDRLNPVRDSKGKEKRQKEQISNRVKIPYENIIVSSFDVDTRVFPKYFSCLTWHYLTCKNPTRTSFQPIPLYINNIWQAPVISRVFSFSATFWQTICQERPEKMLTFSSHAMSFKALVDVGFKQKNVISDDSRVFWQCFFKYDGDYRVLPIFYPVSMDANVAKTFWKTLINIYKQQKRWAYGVGDIPYFLFGFLKNKKIPLRKKLSRAFELIEGHWSWATASILIFSLGWLPLILGGSIFSHSLIAYNLPKIAGKIMTLAMVGLIGSIYFSILLLPPKPPEYGKFKYLIFALGWFLFPLSMIFFTSLPALDAQTRWMLGKYMGFWPTEKFRKS